jgi:hypothetical protein
MKTLTPILALALVLLSGMAAADLPVKAPNTKYTGLWTNSPFTSKPPPPPPGEVISPFEDYALLGVSPVGNGYRVTLTNRKNPEERILIESSRPDAEHGFTISAVNRKPGNPLGTTVDLRKGRIRGTVVFDETLLTLKAPPAAPKAPAQPAAIPGLPTQPGAVQAPGVRAPRPRVVPPPPPAANKLNPQAPPNSGNSQARERASNSPLLERLERRR